jgi:hypothetical protein
MPQIWPVGTSDAPYVENFINNTQSRTPECEYPSATRNEDKYNREVSGHHCLGNTKRIDAECPYPDGPGPEFLGTTTR